jgi:ParB-like chromosome segregation protein Spo0J
MKIEQVSIDKIKPYENNPRKKRDIEKVANSIREFGWQQPIVVDKDNVIIVGHSRLEAAKYLQYKTAPVLIADITPEKAKAYRIADNKTNEYSDWDYGALNKEFTDLLDNNFDLENLGFEEHELESLIVFDDSRTKWLDQDKEWQDMPEYAHNDETPFRSLTMHFMKKEDLETFLKLIKQDVTDRTRWLYFPRQEKQVLKDKAYTTE